MKKLLILFIVSFFSVAGAYEFTQVKKAEDQLTSAYYGEVWYVNIQPTYIMSPQGMSRYLWVACYDYEGRVLPSCSLNYQIYDVFGSPHYYDVAFITNDSYLHVRPWAPQGQYRIEFHAVNSNAWTDIRLDVY